jgi:hypothetical protein
MSFQIRRVISQEMQSAPKNGRKNHIQLLGKSTNGVLPLRKAKAPFTQHKAL